ncbi:MAG: hypothetical protein JXR97_04945 [Planctomycetes bacterium]|nr:hypothetical protein [Planctomycetota bacterium]
MKINGAFAKIYFSCNDGLDAIVEVLKQALQVNSIDIEHDEESPHEEYALIEAMGFEGWIRKNNEYENMNYLLQIESEMVPQLEYQENACDISVWLGCVISLLSNYDACVVSDDGTCMMIHNGIICG